MEIWGIKTIALFDVWSIEHFMTGISISSIVHKFHLNKIDNKNHHYVNVIFLLFIAYFWEGVEFYLEAGYTNIYAITYWFQGVEFWGNRLFTDPAMILLGYLVTVFNNKKRIIWTARFFSLFWLYIHIFIFPHCMYLQEMF